MIGKRQPWSCHGVGEHRAPERFPGRILAVLLWDQGQKPWEEQGVGERCILAEPRFSLSVSALL